MLPARIAVAYTAQELADFDKALTIIENLLARTRALSPSNHF